MSSGQLQWSGMQELRQYLRQLPANLRDEGTVIVEHTAHRAAGLVISKYREHEKSGNLVKGVRVKLSEGHDQGFGVAAIVESTSAHSAIFEFGTADRKTAAGWNRGRSPAHRLEGLIPIAQRERRRMVMALVNLVRRAGFEISYAG